MTETNIQDPLEAFAYADNIRRAADAHDDQIDTEIASLRESLDIDAFAAKFEELGHEINRLRSLTKESLFERMVDEAEAAFHGDDNIKSLPGGYIRSRLKLALVRAFAVQRGNTAGFGQRVPTQSEVTAFLRHYQHLYTIKMSIGLLDHELFVTESQPVVDWLQQLAQLPDVVEVEPAPTVGPVATSPSASQSLSDREFVIQDNDGRVFYRIDENGEHHSVMIDELNQQIAKLKMINATELFQHRAYGWGVDLFGKAILDDKVELSHRLTEESAETVQAGGMTLSEWIQIGEYVWSRKPGDVGQEIGGLMVAISCFSGCHGINMHRVAEDELASLWLRSEKILAKWKNKPKFTEAKALGPIIYPEAVSQEMRDAATQRYKATQNMTMALMAALTVARIRRTSSNLPLRNP